MRGRFLGMELVVDRDCPKGTIELRHPGTGALLGQIVNIGRAPKGSPENPRRVRSDKSGYYVIDERGKRVYVDVSGIEGELQRA